MVAILPTRKIGKTDVTAVGYGLMGMGGMSYGAAPSDEERFKVLDKLYELGCTHWDTANCYGDTEELLGNWFARTGKRKEIFLSTKTGFLRDASAIRLDPEFIKQDVEISLKNLQTDCIDLYYAHRTDPKVPIEDTVEAMAELVKQGKVKYIGLSEASPKDIRRAHAIHPIAALQVEYSPFETEVEAKGGVLDTARELGIAVVAYSPAGRGMISGRYKSPDDFDQDDARRIFPKFSAENFPRITSLVNAFQAIADKHNATSTQVAIAWLLAQGPDVIPISGSKRVKYVEENVAAVHLRLSDEEVKKLRELVDESEKYMSTQPRMPNYIQWMMGGETPERAK